MSVEEHVRAYLYRLSGKVHTRPQRPSFADDFERWQQDLLEEDRRDQQQQEDHDD